MLKHMGQKCGKICISNILLSAQSPSMKVCKTERGITPTKMTQIDKART